MRFISTYVVILISTMNCYSQLKYSLGYTIGKTYFYEGPFPVIAQNYVLESYKTFGGISFGLDYHPNKFKYLSFVLNTNTRMYLHETKEICSNKYLLEYQKCEYSFNNLFSTFALGIRGNISFLRKFELGPGLFVTKRFHLKLNQNNIRTSIAYDYIKEPHFLLSVKLKFNQHFWKINGIYLDYQLRILDNGGGMALSSSKKRYDVDNNNITIGVTF